MEITATWTIINGFESNVAYKGIVVGRLLEIPNIKVKEYRRLMEWEELKFFPNFEENMIQYSQLGTWFCFDTEEKFIQFLEEYYKIFKHY